MNKTIFITGAAEGIGAQTARYFIERGWKVGLFDIQMDKLAALANELGGQAMYAKLDVCNPEDWQQALDAFINWAGRLDVLLNNAGVLVSGPLASTDFAGHARSIDINVKGTLLGCQKALPYLRQTENSRVINLSSAAAIYGVPDLSSYSASKFAVRGLTEALDLEWDAYGIRVMDIMPLFVQTKMVDGMNARANKRLGVHLTPMDVAQKIWRVAHVSPKFAKTHWPVGLLSNLSYMSSGWLPARIDRLLNRFIMT
jgi:NADP-dependent 3-hydroxy acid dehydrogenase YdfG